MGNVLKEIGEIEDAKAAFKKALAIESDFAMPWYNLGNLLLDQGKVGDAIEAYNKAVGLKPDYALAYYNMSLALKKVIFKKPNLNIHNGISSLLDKKTYVRPIEISRAVISLLKTEPNLQQYLDRANTHEGQQDPLGIVSDLSKVSLLMKLMRVCPLTDLELEKLLKQLRALCYRLFPLLRRYPLSY